MGDITTFIVALGTTYRAGTATALRGVINVKTGAVGVVVGEVDTQIPGYFMEQVPAFNEELVVAIFKGKTFVTGVFHVGKGKVNETGCYGDVCVEQGAIGFVFLIPYVVVIISCAVLQYTIRNGKASKLYFHIRPVGQFDGVCADVVGVGIGAIGTTGFGAILGRN